MKPLAGLLVIDFSQFLSGPSASLRMADLGARVIKIERPGVGDLCRQLYISNLSLDGDSTLFHSINRNKQVLRRRPEESRRPRARPQVAHPRRRDDPELPSGRHREDRPRIRSRSRAEPAHRLRRHHRLRKHRTVARQARSRPAGPVALRPALVSTAMRRSPPFPSALQSPT